MCMRKVLVPLALLVMLTVALIPSVSFTEDRDTVLLARTIYALAGHESYETKLAIGTVVMNRVEDPWFADSLGAVLTEQQQFPAGSRYDDASLRAAHEVLSGTRVLSGNAFYYRKADAGGQMDAGARVGASGCYTFYSDDGRF